MKLTSSAPIIFPFALICLLVTPADFLGVDDGLIKVGVLLEYSESEFKGKSLEGAVEMALVFIKQQHRFLFGYNLTYFVDDSGCDPITSSGALGKMIFIDKVNVVIGPSCQLACVASSYMAASHNIPIISHGCPGYSLSNKTVFPTFSRSRSYARQSVRSTSEMLVKFIQDMKWVRVGLLYEDDPIWLPFANEVSGVLQNNAIQMLEEDLFDMHEAGLEGIIKQFKEKSRIIILAGGYAGVKRVLEIMREIDMFNGDYAIITIDFFDEEAEQRAKWSQDFNNGRFDGIIDIGVPGFDLNSASFNAFNEELRLRLLRAPHYYQVTGTVYSLSPYAYDAVLLYAYGLRRAIQAEYIEHMQIAINHSLDSFLSNETFMNNTPGANNTDHVLYNYAIPSLNLTFINDTFSISKAILSGTNITEQMFNLTFKGLSGTVSMDEHGDRIPLNLQLKKLINGVPSAFGEYDTTAKTYSRTSEPYFPSGSNIPPSDKPPCGFNNNECPVEKKLDTTAIAIGLTSPFAFIALLFLVYAIYKRQKYENDLLDSRYYIKYSDLIPYRYQRKSKHGAGTAPPSVVKTTVQNGGFVKPATSMSELGFPKPVFTVAKKFAAKYKFDKVFVKKFAKGTLHVNRDILVELKEVRDVVSINVNKFLGVCIESPNICIVESYCSKGSLQDVLRDDEIPIDMQFRVSFAYDIALGMLELHESKISIHGNLTSKAVLVDNRWMCKITDYGLQKFKDTSELQAKQPRHLRHHDQRNYTEQLWRAPELISVNVHKQSKQGDVYSYGIVLSEVITRMEPFESYGYEPKDILHFVQKRCIPPFRPYVRLESGIDGRLLDLMRKCWTEDYTERPTFQEVRQALRTIRKPTGNDARNDATSLLDNTITMMEKYSMNLEKTVTERTEMLAKEKEKVETVLHRLVPRKVADKLKHGDYIVPESIESMSVMVSDIIGFSSFTAQSTPLQVVELLNDFYTYFDGTIQPYECFKIETEGEKCLVTSGVPKGTGEKHTEDIAIMSLTLLSNLKHAKIRHLGTELLMLRLALHTGPCVAGVIGAKAPRFCIFGDTVTHARHVQHTGPPLRIQITPQFRYRLLEVGGYEMSERGRVNIKGKGEVRTYFLDGKTNSTLSLPPPVRDILFEKESLGSTLLVHSVATKKAKSLPSRARRQSSTSTTDTANTTC